MEKKIYESPEIEVVLTDDSDIVLTSSGSVEEIPWESQW